jgi:hypothetical protein
VRQPSRASAPPPDEAEPLWPTEGSGNSHPTEGVLLITPQQRKKFADVAIECGYTPDRIKAVLLEFWGLKSSADIPASKYDEVLQYFTSCGAAKPEKPAPYQATDQDLLF